MIRGKIALFVCLLAGITQGQSFTAATIAGATHYHEGAAATSVFFDFSQGLALDGAGGYYFCSSTDGKVYRVKADGTITLIAGGAQGSSPGDGGPALNAVLFYPVSLALDNNSNLYIADYLASVVRKVALKTGIITTVAGNGHVALSGDNGPATQAGMNPASIALDPAGQFLFIADQLNNRIRKVDLTSGVISTIAGNGTLGPSAEGAVATASPIYLPTGISVDSAGNVAFVENTRVRGVKASTGTIVALAGTMFAGFGSEGVVATNSALPFPESTAYDNSGNLIIGTDYDIRKVAASTGIVSRLAGTQVLGLRNGPANNAIFAGVVSVLAAGPDDYLFTDANHRVGRLVSGTVSTVAGSDVKDGGPATSAFLNSPEGVIADAQGNLFIADSANSLIRKINSGGTISTVIGTSQTASGSQNEGLVRSPSGLATDDTGNLYVVDTANIRVLRLSAGSTTAQRIAGGNGDGFSGDGGTATAAKFSSPRGIAVDKQGNIYIADFDNERVRKIDAATGVINTIVGTGSIDASGDGGPASAAACDCRDIAVDAAGNLYLADFSNNRIRRVDATSGVITTVAGTGTDGYAGDGGKATLAEISLPTSVAVDAAGNLYITDWGNNVVRMVTPAGIIRTIAGTGKLLANGDSGAAAQMNLDPRWIKTGPSGTLLLSDLSNDRILRLSPQTAATLTVTQGQGQSATTGSKVTLTILVSDAQSLPVANANVTFNVLSGAATLSTSAVTTGPDGLARVDVTLGNTVGPVSIRAAFGALNVTIGLTVVAGPSQTGPVIKSGGIAGAGLSIPPVRVLVPLGLATIFGERFAPAGTIRRVTAADLVDGQVPTAFASVCVDLDGTRAPIASVTDTQISFQTPLLTPGTQVNVRVIKGCGSGSEETSDPEKIAVQASAPEFFSFVLNADGHNPIAATDALTGAYIGAPGLIPGATFTPAQIGETVSLYANNYGKTSTNLQAGVIPQGLNPVNAPVSITIGGQPVAPEDVLYVGVAPFNPGLYQINLTLKAGIPSGDQPVVVTVGGVANSTGAYLTIAP